MAVNKKKKTAAKAKPAAKGKSTAKSRAKSPVKSAAKSASKTKTSAPSKPKAKVKTSVKAKTTAKSSAPLKTNAPFKTNAPLKASTKKKSTPVFKQLKAKMKSAVASTIHAVESLLHPDIFKALTPLEDRLVVHVEAAAQTTAGGLIIPGASDQKSNRGKVLAIGRGRRGKKGGLRPLDVKPGEFVLFPEHAGTKVRLQGTDVLILREEDVLAVSEK